jgi:hypothetical protein
MIFKHFFTFFTFFNINKISKKDAWQKITRILVIFHQALVSIEILWAGSLYEIAKPHIHKWNLIASLNYEAINNSRYLSILTPSGLFRPGSLMIIRMVGAEMRNHFCLIAASTRNRHIMEYKRLLHSIIQLQLQYPEIQLLLEQKAIPVRKLYN